MSPWGIPEKPHQQRAHSAGIEKVETGMKVSVVLGSANRFNLQSNTNKGKGEGGGIAFNRCQLWIGTTVSVIGILESEKFLKVKRFVFLPSILYPTLISMAQACFSFSKIGPMSLCDVIGCLNDVESSEEVEVIMVSKSV